MAFPVRPLDAPVRFCLLFLGLAIIAAGVGGCSTSPGARAAFASAAPDAPAGIAATPAVIAVTTRNAVNGGRSKPWFGTQRASQASNVRIEMSPPADNALAAVGLGDWRIRKVEAIPLGEGLSTGIGRRDVLIYVHGFNQNFETAALDAARLSDGLKFSGATMLFSWPSKNSMLNYIYDRESALWSRDAMEDMLDQLVREPSVGTIHIVAHSMGTMVTVEALRQLYDRRGASMSGRFGAVILASPDIDMDSFTSSVTRLGGFSRNITVLTVAGDRALGTMRDMAGGVTRVGIAEKEQLDRLGVRVIDASQLAGGGLNHDLFLTNPQVRQTIRSFIDNAKPPAIASGGSSADAIQ
jgi:esterase/lipase superfamily enzyme